MANLTIALDDEILRRARVKALRQGTSVNALLRESLIQYAATRSAQEQAAKRFLELAAKSMARRGARRFTRDELHARRRHSSMAMRSSMPSTAALRTSASARSMPPPSRGRSLCSGAAGRC